MKARQIESVWIAILCKAGTQSIRMDHNTKRTVELRNMQHATGVIIVPMAQHN